VPPISACDDDGRPNHQVARFQQIAPTRPPNTTVGVIAPASTIPPATVAATFNEINAPTQFRIAATPTASFGRSAPVAMLVAIAFAASWNPKSKLSATATTSATTMSPASSASGTVAALAARTGPLHRTFTSGFSAL
jgi:hypothetical protein